MVFEDSFLVPYPKEIKKLGGEIRVFSYPDFIIPPQADQKEKLAVNSIKQLLKHLPSQGTGKLTIRIGSLSTLEDPAKWLLSKEIEVVKGLASEQGYLLIAEDNTITIVGKGPIGALYGVQTLMQLLREEPAGFMMPCVRILDYPAVEKRVLNPAMSWYAGYGRIGFAMQLWGWERWKWFIDWCLQHKINGLNICLYGFWPFRFDEYPETILKDLEMKTWLKEIGGELTIRYSHPNIIEEFLPELIKYANERGIEVYAYFGLNTFNGGYAVAYPESRYISSDPERFRQFKYNLCPSRDDVVEYLTKSVRKIIEIGFNGIVFEESEGSVFCECSKCQSKYYADDKDPRKALHKADYGLLNKFYSVIKEANPEAIFGVRMWRMGSETEPEYLREAKTKIPPDTMIFWSNGIDYSRFVEWVKIFGPDKIMGQDAESLGFAACYGKLLYLIPEQYETYLKLVDPTFEPTWPMHLRNDIRQYQQAAKHKCRGATGYAFEWYGLEIAHLCLAQYAWNPFEFEADVFFQYGFKHLFGSELGHKVAESTLGLPIVLETRICEGVAPIIPRSDPMRGGLAGLTSLTIPTLFKPGEKEIRALEQDLGKAERSLKLAQEALQSFQGDPQYVISLRYLETAAKRTVAICRAGIEYRKALQLAEEEKSDKKRIIAHLEAALRNVEEDYQLVKENFYDFTDELYDRIPKAINTIKKRLDLWKSPKK